MNKVKQEKLLKHGGKKKTEIRKIKQKGIFEVFEKQGYRIKGNSGVKICNWLRNALSHKRFCYKNKFYGIMSHRCIQCTPSVFKCTHNCRFCWRVIPEEIGYEVPEMKWEEPEEFVDFLLKEHLRLISGFGGNAGVDVQMLKEAKEPKHAAISLAGEPTLYPYLPEMLNQFRKRRMTTFLVTNATIPDAIQNLMDDSILPTQMYYSLAFFDERNYKRTTRSILKNGWEKFNESLELMRNMNTRTVLRMTLAKGLNFSNPEKYSKLISKGEPDYVEVKAFMFVGGARSKQRGLKECSMPSHEEIKDFSARISKYTGYEFIDEHLPSRVVLLSKDEKSAKKRMLEFE